MLKNYLKIALRHLKKHKGYSFINIIGLALGLACCVLILFFVQDELSFDRFHTDADRIYRVVFNGYAPNSPPDRFSSVSRPVGRVMREEYPEVEHLVRFNYWNPVVKHQGTYFYDDDVLFAEPELFDVFSFPLLKGDPATALREPNTLVLTETAERKYFGDEDALGRTLTLNDTLAFTVTGVLADFPHNSHFSADFFVSYQTLLDRQPEDQWLNIGTWLYLKLHEGVDAKAFEANITDLIQRNYGDQLANLNLRTELVLEPLTEIYLYSDRGGQFGPTGDITHVYIFSAIALFVLLIACINFMNLATARSMERAKEVGVRKVVGSSRTMLIRQFLSESMVLCLLGLVIAAGLIAAALPFFNELAGKEIALGTLLSPGYAFGLLAVTLLVGLLSGSYPAFLLSGFRSIEVLKGHFRSSRRGALLRQGLVVFQFAISVALIACTALVFDQLDFMRNQDLGFDKEQVLVINAQGLPNTVMSEQYKTAKNEFARSPAVRQVSASAVVPGRSPWLNLFTAEGLQENDSRRGEVVVADADYLDTYQIDVVAGRNLSDAFETDEAEAILINEAAVGYLGWGTPQQALGKTIDFGGGERTVVGVMHDYHHNSLKEALEPMLLFSNPPSFNFFSLRLDATDVSATMAQLETTWKSLFPGYTFETFFLDADFDTQYHGEQRLMRILGAFSSLAILIACLGLFGLAAFTAQQRTKEIGVRKVLGASVPGIILLLSKDFTRLVLVGFGVAVPVAYFTMDAWLDAFPYRIDIAWPIFLMAGLTALVIAWLTVSYQSIRAAFTNPVNALRYE